MEEKWVIEENKNGSTSVKKKTEPKDSVATSAEIAADTEADEQASLSLLALEPDTIEDSHESAEEIADYASFLASYNSVMAERLAKVRAASAQTADDEEKVTDAKSDTAPETEEITELEEKGEETETEELPDATDAPEEKDEEIEVIVKQDIEFHKEIVSKSERVNAEDHIVLVTKDEEDALTESDENCEEISGCDSKTEVACEENHSASYEEYEKEAKISLETLEYDPHQISMVISEEKKDEPADPSRYDAKRPRIIDYVYDALEMIVITLMAAIVITSIFFRFSFVDGHSMDRTLSDGDTLIISNLFYTPEYGDIVVIEYENNIHEVKPLIKRVIGLPGDTIKVTAEGDVYRNGELLNEEEYVYLDGPLFATLKGEWKVGEDEVFVMGDHRNDSMDSREIGPIKMEKIIGHAIFRLFPIKDIGTID